MLAQFRNDPFYLAKYHWAVGSALLLINFSLFGFQGASLSSYWPVLLLASSTEVTWALTAFIAGVILSVLGEDFSIWFFLGVAPAIILTFPITAFLHGGSHDNMKPRWLNRPLGELAALFQLTGFPDWKILHVFHHRHPDHPELDPHPPLTLGYWEFTRGMRQTISRVFLNYFIKYHGDNQKSKNAIRLFLIGAKFNMLMKVSFWFLVLGPQLFTFFYLPSVVFKMCHYAWFNYATHQTRNGKTEIVNLNSRVYQLVNKISFGLYFHGNHHRFPQFFNPGKVPASKLQGQESVASTDRKPPLPKAS